MEPGYPWQNSLKWFLAKRESLVVMAKVHAHTQSLAERGCLGGIVK